MNELEKTQIVRLVLWNDVSRENLLNGYALLKEINLSSPNSRKLLAEVCFLLAKSYLSSGETDQARVYAQESLALYEDLEISSLKSAEPVLSKHLPEIMHEGVVKARLGKLLRSDES